MQNCLPTAKQTNITTIQLSLKITTNTKTKPHTQVPAETSQSRYTAQNGRHKNTSNVNVSLQNLRSIPRSCPKLLEQISDSWVDTLMVYNVMIWLDVE